VSSQSSMANVLPGRRPRRSDPSRVSKLELRGVNTVSLEAVDSLLNTWRPGKRDHGREIQVLDFFSGCGGMSLGFSAVAQKFGRYRLVGAIDINLNPLASYQRNFGVATALADVRQLANKKGELEKVLGSLENYDAERPTVVIGCAPCQGFSGHRKKSWNRIDKRNDLVAAFARVALELRPVCVVMENVPELLSQRYWRHFEEFKRLLHGGGYTVKAAIQNAAEFGAPQERFRAVVIAMKRTDFGLPEPFVCSTDFRTVRDAIGKLPRVAPGQQSPSDPLHRSANHRESTIRVIESVPLDGGSRPPGIGPPCLDRVKGFYDVYGRLHWDRPAITVTHYARNPASGRFVHPEQNRGLTMREAARLQGFPDSFKFEGGFDQVFRQIGEAVPPHMSTCTALAVLNNLDRGGSKLTTDLITSPVSNSYGSVIAAMKMRRA